MRTLLALAVILALSVLVGPSATPSRLSSGAAASAQVRPTATEGAPITAPQPEPTPVFMPHVLRAYDPRLPAPLGETLEGYVAALTRAGREACAPGTHVLLTRPEGTRGAEPVAVAYAARPGADLNLDFYLGDHVEVSGATDLAPDACVITWRVVRVERIARRDVPPR